MQPAGKTKTAHRPRRWYSPRAIAQSVMIRPRVYWAALAAIGLLLLLPRTFSVPARAAIAWDLGALVYLALGFQLMHTCSAEVVRTRAARQDDSAVVILALILLAIASSFASIVGLLNEAKAARELKLAYMLLAASTIVLSWTVTQVAFTLHYAHEFYRPSDNEQRMAGGLDFRGDDNPDYWDFFYFATSIGAASQTSDVSIRTKALRRLVTLHAIVSFFFNTAVLALALNLAAGLI
jgi:uncharacterized membrane protein